MGMKIQFSPDENVLWHGLVKLLNSKGYVWCDGETIYGKDWIDLGFGNDGVVITIYKSEKTITWMAHDQEFFTLDELEELA